MTVYPDDLKQELIDIIAIANKGENFSLTNRQLTMLFYWARNKDKPEFKFVKEAFPNDPFINNKKAKARNAKKQKSAKKAKKSKTATTKKKEGNISDESKNGK